MTRTTTAVLAALLGLAGCGGPGQRVSEPEPATGDDAPSAAEPAVEPVTVRLFVMSRCKFAAVLVPVMHEAVQAMGEHVDYEQYHLLSRQEGGSLKCLYGQDACEADLVQLCAQAVDPARHLALAACMFERHESMPEGWQSCASGLGMDVAAIATCVEGEQGQALADENIAVVAESGARGSPTVHIDGAVYEGGRTVQDLLAGICLAIPEIGRPVACPVDEEAYGQVSLLAVADHDPPAVEAIEKDESDDGVLDGVQEVEGTIDLFVMSYCPYAIKAMNVLPELGAILGEEVPIRIHYITRIFDQDEYDALSHTKGCERYQDGLWYCSLHGKKETDENIRQLCAAAEAPDRYLDYITCRNADISFGGWEKCAEMAGIAVEAIEQCAGSREGLDLLGESAEKAGELGITASPTWVFNRKYTEKLPPSVDEVVSRFCEHNESLEACADGT
jgi:2-hydroxychromene-2-carboxylate isomerase